MIHAAAVPNDLAPAALRRRPGRGGAVRLTAAGAGWRYLAFETVRLRPDQRLAVGSPEVETLVVIVAGGGLEIEEDGHPRRRLRGRRSPFDDLPSAVYLPPAATVHLTARPAAKALDLAIARAPVDRRPGARPRAHVVEARDIAVEIRGAGRATRQIDHLVTPAFPAQRLLAVECLTPAGNWSSWPPHKHDTDAMPDEAVLEEVYHYRFRRPGAWAVQRLYRGAASAAGGPRDAAWAVRDGDLIVVTDGYHPFAASPSDDAWYLNVLAGDRRTMACSYDPDVAPLPAAWAGQPPDPRVPLVGRTGGV